MFKKTTINLGNLILSLSKALDLADIRIMEHSQRVAYIALKIADYTGLEEKDRDNLFLASLLHDIGISSSHLKLEARRLDIPEELLEHCVKGRRMLECFPPLTELGDIIYHHHDKWGGPNPSGISKEEIPLLSRIVFVADRLDSQLERDRYILLQKDDVMSRLQKYSGTYFCPDIMDSLWDVSKKDFFWLDMTSEVMWDSLKEEGAHIDVKVDTQGMKSIAHIFSQIIDGKSRFTARHSQGVALLAREIAARYGFSRNEQDKFEVAGLLHDLGKLAIPDEILEYPGALSLNEYNVIRMHPYYTYHLLQGIDGFELISEWAAMHHERMDGQGYPFHLSSEELSLGSKIVAISDVYQALTENRPYRKAFPEAEAKAILLEMGRSGALDRGLVELLYRELPEIQEEISVAMDPVV